MRNARTITILFSSVILFLMFGCATPEQNTPDIVDVPYVANNNANRISEDETPETPYNNYPDDESDANEAMMATISFAQAYGLTVNEDGLIEIIVPENLLGGRTAEATADSYIAMGERAQAILTDVCANADGTMTKLQTLEQLTLNKYNMRTFSMFHEREYVTTIKDVIFTDDEMLTEITVLVDSYRYIWHMLERTMIQGALVVLAGTYQILNGAAPDDWHVTITVKDYETGEIVSITEFPHDDMFTIHIGYD